MADILKKYSIWVVIFLLSLFTLQVIYEIITYTSTYDESANINAGYAYFKMENYVDGHPQLRAAHILLYLLYNQIGIAEPGPVLIWARIVTLFYGLLLGMFVFYVAKRLFGINAGLFALLLYVFEPNIIAHSSLVTSDILVTGTIFIATYCFKRFLDNQSQLNMIVAGLTLGLALLSKFTAMLLIPIFIILEIIHLSKNNKTTHICYFASILIIALLVINVFYQFNGSLMRQSEYNINSQTLKSAISFAGDIPIPLPRQYLENLDFTLSHVSRGHDAYLLGDYSGTGWWYYFIVAFLLKTPIPLIILIVLGTYLLYRKKTKFQNIDFIILPVLIILIAFSFFNKINIGLRYILPIYPFLIVLASPSVDLLREKRVKILMFFLIAWYISSAVLITPHNLAYFNEFISNPANSYKYLIDSNLDWGQGNNFVDTYIKSGNVTIIRSVECDYTPGRIGVYANELADLFGSNKKCHEWLRNMTPVDHVGGGVFLIFDVPKK